MQPVRIGMKYRFILFSIATIVLTVLVGSAGFHWLVHQAGGYATYHLFLLAGFYILVGIAGVLLISKYMIQPIQYLIQLVRRVQQGDLTLTIPVNRTNGRRDEMDQLMEGFHHMVRSLRANIEQLTRAKEQAERTSQELFQSKSRLEAIFNGISDGIMILDRNYRIVSANPVIEQFMGRPLSEIKGQYCYQMCNGTMQRCDFCQADVTFRTGAHASSYCLKKPANFPEERILEIHDFPLYNENGEVEQIIEYVKDVTEAVKSQARLENDRRLAQIGELAAKVAHEVRNPLNAIQGATHYLRAENTNPDWETYLVLIEQQVNRLNRVASSLLQFSKPSPPPLYPGRLDTVLERTINVVRDSLEQKGISVRVQIEPDLPAIPLDEPQLEQVLLNLIQNAADAMPEGGILTCSLQLKQHGQNGGGEFLLLEIQDTGIGMDEHVLQHVFEPFYTTKTKGTGLGLSIVQKIIESHQGQIDIESQKGAGTRISISLPTQPKTHDAKEHHFSH